MKSISIAKWNVPGFDRPEFSRFRWQDLWNGCDSLYWFLLHDDTCVNCCLSFCGVSLNVLQAFCFGQFSPWWVVWFDFQEILSVMDGVGPCERKPSDGAESRGAGEFLWVIRNTNFHGGWNTKTRDVVVVWREDMSKFLENWQCAVGFEKTGTLTFQGKGFGDHWRLWPGWRQLVLQKKCVA